MLKAKRDKPSTFEPVDRPIPELNKPQDGVKETTNIVTQPTRTTVTDLDRIPKQYLMKYLEGSAWTVDFFNFLKGRNDAKKFFDSKVLTPDQQVEKIIGLELRVTTPLDRSQDTTNKTFSMSGAATIANSIIPNEGCFFIAPIGDGRFALFNVTNVVRMSNNKVATYNIEYTLLFEVDPETAETIRRCTVREYYYVAERAWTGGDTLLTPKEYRAFLEVVDAIEDIEQTYVKRFYDGETATLLFPHDRYSDGLRSRAYYDVFLALFVRALGLRTVGKDIQIYPHPPMNVEDIETVWTALLQQSPTFLADYKRDSTVWQPKTFRTMQHRNSVTWSLISDTRFFTEELKPGYGMAQRFPGQWPEWKPFEPVEVENYRGNEGESIPAFLPLSFKPYLLSETFYDGSYSSLLEYGLYLYLHKRPLPSVIALKLFEEVYKLPKDAQFYYIPMVYLLLRYSRD